MPPHPLAGKPAPESLLANIPRLTTAFFLDKPDPADPDQRVAFGTSGHRGVSFKKSFNEDHIAAVTQAVCEHRAKNGVTGPLFIGVDTHALSEPAFAVALEVLAANCVEVRYQEGFTPTPTPVVSQAILAWNLDPLRPRADGVVVTPSHNPPDNGGFKYNPPHGGPADTAETKAVEARANALLEAGLAGVKRLPYARALASDCVRAIDFVGPYVAELDQMLDFERIRAAGLKIGVDPMGGSGIFYWDRIAEAYDLPLTVVNRSLDPTFRFMRVDHDGKIRMDCSSPYAMAGLIHLKDSFDVAFGNDPDYDRHGIVDKNGLMNPNHYLAVSCLKLFSSRPRWKADLAVGKTLVSSAIIDRVAAKLGRRVIEVPVGFKWFVDGLIRGEIGFCGEESAGATFLRKNGTVWTTDKDGIVMDLLACEITAASGKTPSEIYSDLTTELGEPVYERLDAKATKAQKAAFNSLTPDKVTAKTLAGEVITAVLTKAPGNDAPIGGLKVTTLNGWFAARPSGTEDVYKIYAESFLGPDHLKRIQSEAQELVGAVFKACGV